MNTKILLAVTTGLVVFISGGCQPTSADVEEPQKPPVAFQGKPDAKFVGTWKTVDKRSVYSFKADGAYTIKTHVNTPGGGMDTQTDGSWLADAEHFLMKDKAGNVVPYNFKVEGNKLSLSLTGSMKRETVMVKNN